MSLMLHNTEEKPYNRCIDCIHIGKKCDGPDFLAMEINRLCEWARLRKEYLHRKDPKWTNAYVAEHSDVSLTTANRFFAGIIDDLKFSTAAQILKVLVDGTWGQYPCAMAANEGSSDFEAECEHLRELLGAEKAKTAYLKEQVSFKDSQLLAKDKVISERGDFAVRQRRDLHILAALLGVCIVVILGALVIDRLNPEIGFFWLG